MEAGGQLTWQKKCLTVIITDYKEVCDGILLPANEKNQLEILNAAWLLQPDYPKEGLFVVGIADSFENALEYVEKISQEVYDSTKGLDIRNYILMKEREG